MTDVYLNNGFDLCDEHRILEVPSDFNVSNVLHLTSDADNQLLLCSASETFLVRKVEYSNTLLVSKRKEKRARSEEEAELSRGGDGVVWGERQSRIFEVSRCRPRCDEVIDKLRQNYLTLDELECPTPPPNNNNNNKNSANHHLSLLELAVDAPCSFGELLTELVKNGALLFRDQIRLLHPSVVSQAVNAVMLFVGGQQVDSSASVVRWGDVELHFVPDVYPKVLMDVVRCVLCVDNAPSVRRRFPITDVVELSKKACLRYLAEFTLESMRDASMLSPSSEPSGLTFGHSRAPLHWVSVSEFLERWMTRIPLAWVRESASLLANAKTTTSSDEGASSSSSSKENPEHSARRFLEEVLRGFVVLHPLQSGPTTPQLQKIAWCDPNTLPRNVEDRVRLLFSFSPGKWESADLKAFVVPILEPDGTFEAAIAKVCRDHRTPGRPVTYSLHA